MACSVCDDLTVVDVDGPAVFGVSISLVFNLPSALLLHFLHQYSQAPSPFSSSSSPLLKKFSGSFFSPSNVTVICDMSAEEDVTPLYGRQCDSHRVVEVVA